MDISEMSLCEIKHGYKYNEHEHKYVCAICGACFEEGEIYEYDGKLYQAGKMADIHMHKEHGGMFEYLMSLDSDYISLTPRQRDLMKLFYSNITDKEIAARLGIAESTVRHQRFRFKEKARQAKMYLALYELSIANMMESF